MSDYNHSVSLEYVAGLLNREVHNGLTFKVEETWEDYGAGLRWKNIIVYGDWCEYQLLCRPEMDTLDHGTMEEQVDLLVNLIYRLRDKK